MISEIQQFRPCDEPAAVPWLSVSETSGSTAAGGSSEVTVLVDSTGLAPGAHEAHLCVTTNDPESPLVEVPVTVTVTDQTCDRTIIGSYTKALTISRGLTCLAHGSGITGAVRVEAGASLHATGSVVIGPLLAEGAARIELTRSVLFGPVTLREGTTQIAVVANSVSGPVWLDRNVTGPTPIVVAANTVVGPLKCAGNEPPPVNNGQPNTVFGRSSGQCRDL